MVGDQFHLVAQVPSQVVLNRVWDVIQQVDSQYADLKHEVSNTGGQEGSYTIQGGDNLSKVTKLFYGDPHRYEAMARANGTADANKDPSRTHYKDPRSLANLGVNY